MAKGPNITPVIQALVAVVYQQHPKWKAPKVRNEVESILRERNPNSPPKYPSLSTVQKMLATIRKSEETPSPLDMSWSVASLVKYPISPEALPAVLRVWASLRINKLGFTIRDALWVARLYTVSIDIETLASLTLRFGRLERLYEQYRIPSEFHEWYDSKWEDLVMFSYIAKPRPTQSEQKKILGISNEEWRDIQENLGDFMKIGKTFTVRDAAKSMHPTRYRHFIKKEPNKEGGTG